MRNSARVPRKEGGELKLGKKYLTRQNSAMSGQNSVYLDTMTEQCVKVIFGSVYIYMYVQ